MRTTLTLDEDVAETSKAIAARLKKPLKAIINEALRIGLVEVEKPLHRRPYHTQPQDMGLRKGLSLDNVHELLSQIEGENYH